MVDLRNGISTSCQPIRPKVTHEVQPCNSLIYRYMRLWSIRREFLKTGFVHIPHRLNVLA